MNLSAHRLARYVAVGATAVGANLALFALLVGVLGWGYLVATVVIFFLVTGGAFIFNRAWVFRHDGAVAPSLGRYYLITAISLALNLILMRLLVETVGLHYLVASLVNSLLLAAANFAAHTRITFGEASRRRS